MFASADRLVPVMVNLEALRSPRRRDRKVEGEAETDRSVQTDSGGASRLEIPYSVASLMRCPLSASPWVCVCVYRGQFRHFSSRCQGTRGWLIA
jgi:hypothetical protein